MLNRLFVVDSVTLTSTGTAVSSYTPWDQTTRKLPTQVVVKATGQGAYVRLSNDASAATNADVLVQGGDHVVLSVQGRRWVSVLSDGASSTVNVGALSTGVSGSAASLDLAFVDAGVLDPRVTFTRASTATYFDSAGVLTSAAINAPRFDYNPATLAARGLLIEEQRTNLMLYSEQFDNAWWTKTRCSITADATNAPTGTAVADKLVEDTSVNLSHPLISTTVTLSGTTVHSFSVFAKAAERTAMVLRINAGADGIYGSFNLSTGAVGTVFNSGTGSGATLSIQNVGNGWYRCTLTGICSSTSTTPTGVIYPAVSTTDPAGTSIVYTGDGTSGIFVFGAQLEAGAFPTSYIPTTTTALTRSADVASVNTLSPWFNATAGTLYAQVSLITVSNDANRFVAALSDGTTANYIGVFRQTDQQPVGQVQTSAGTQAALGAGAVWTTTASRKLALSYATNDFKFCTNGGTVFTDTAGTVPTVTQLQLGLIGSSFRVNGWLERVTFYPRVLSSAELQAITT